MSLRDMVMSVGFSGSKAVKGLKNVDKAADKAKDAMSNLGKQAQDTGKGIGGLGKDSSVAKRALDTLGRGLDTAKRKTKDLGAEAKRVGTQMRTEFKDAMEDAAPTNMFEGAKRLGAVALAGGVAGAAVLTGGGKAAISFESAFADVRKTVDTTEEEYASIKQQIRDMAKTIPSVHEDIAGVVALGGQLGVSTPGLMGFSRTMIDLGVATNMTSDEAATALARFANITQMSEKEYGRLGSTIVDLGNNLATTESEIVEMGMRLAGAGHQVGLAESDVLAFAGAMSSVGIEAQAGGTAFSKVMIDMANQVATNGKKLGQFAKVAGLSVTDFKAAYQQDASGAIISFIEGLGEMSAEGKNVFGVLDDLGFSEIRVRDALLRASGAGDLFRRSMDIGSQAWAENLALSKEASERYKTTESQLTMLKNKIRDLGITLGDMLSPHIKGAAEGIGRFVETLQGLPPGAKKVGAMALLIGTGLLLIAGPILLLIGFLPSLAAGFGMLGTISLGALGPIALAIAGVVAAGVLLYKNWDKIKELGRAFIARIQLLGERIREAKDNAVSWLKQLPGEVAEQLGYMVGRAVTVLQDLPGTFSAWFRQSRDSAIQWVSALPSKIGEFLSSIPGQVKESVGAIWNSFMELGRAIPDAIVYGFNKAKEAIGGVGKWVIEKAALGVESAKRLGQRSREGYELGRMPKLAKGTKNFGGGLAMVGELGPELVHLPRGSRVTPHDESARMLRSAAGGGLPSLYVDIGDITINTSSNSIKETIPDIKKAIRQAVRPEMEEYFSELRTKRPSVTTA